MDIPVPQTTPNLVEYLASKLGSKLAARRALAGVAEEFGISATRAPENVSSAILLTKMGADPERLAKSLAWDEFENYCALAISAGGYSVSRNVRIRKPTRQIDILAESATLVLSIDCKHWRRGMGLSGLLAVALAQTQRTKLYLERKSAFTPEPRPFLPVLLTLIDNQARVVEGVPVVPLLALRGFLTSVTRFDEGLAFISSPPG